MRHVDGDAETVTSGGTTSAGGTASPRGTASVGLGLILVSLAGTLLVGAVQKAPCTTADWSDGRQYRLACYTDIVPLFGTEQLAGGRLPFLDACAPADTNCDEYPVVTMYVMRLAGWISGDDPGRFFWVNALFLVVGAAVTAVALALLDPRRALWFALAPSLALESFVNWDLVAVALAAAGTLAFLRRGDRAAGVLLGLGAAAKLFPALFLVPFAAERLRERHPDRAITLWWWAAGAWLVVNAPFAIAAPAGWWEFFRFNGARPVDWDSLWSIACRVSTGDAGAGGGLCFPTAAVNALSLVATGVVVWAVWWAKRRREPDFPRWQLAFPLLIAFLVLGKVYSPQFSLWLLPWFALVERDLRRFVAFEVADVAVFLTRLWFFGDLTGVGGTPRWLFEAAVVVRAAVLVLVVVAWVRGPSRGLARGRAPAAAGAAAR
jgi:uncharacterized membrane protein